MAMAGFGIVDVVLRLINDRPVASVAGQKISIEVFDRVLKNELRRIQSQFPDLEINKSRLRDIQKNILDQMAQEIALEKLLETIGIRTSNDIVKEYIKGSFQKDGQFKYEEFKKMLDTNRVSEANIIDNVRKNVSVNQLISPISAFIEFPDFYKKFLLDIFTRKHNLIVCDIPLKSIHITNYSKDAEQKFFMENKKRYQIPSKRKISFLMIHHDHLKNRDKDLVELSGKIDDALGEGKPFEEIAKMYHLEQKDVWVNAGQESDDLSFLEDDMKELVLKNLENLKEHDESSLLEKGKLSLMMRAVSFVKEKPIEFKDLKKYETIHKRFKSDFHVFLQRKEVEKIATSFIKNEMSSSKFESLIRKYDLQKPKHMSVSRLDIQTKKVDLSFLNLSSDEVWEIIFSKKEKAVFVDFSKEHCYFFFVKGFKNSTIDKESAQFLQILLQMAQKDYAHLVQARAKELYPLDVNEERLKIFENNDA